MGLTKVNHPDLLDLASDTGATVFPKGTTEERPVSPEAGYIRFNTTDNVMETYDGTEWLTLDTINTEYSIDYLVVAGGAGGNTANSGGGGAGGYLELSSVVNKNQNYVITVGAGGAKGVDLNNPASNGENSSLIGGSINTISLGGGYGGARYGAVANQGGSGGGGGADPTNISNIGAQGTTGQGFSGANGTDSPYYRGGGGGGASANATNANGANGLQSSITGAAVYYAGGGGGGANSGPGTGGLGGGGAGTYSGTGGNGTPNTGGGAGSSAAQGTGGNGGSGVVILRMPTANYSGTTTGSPTVTTDGSDTILTYTSSGTYTA